MRGTKKSRRQGRKEEEANPTGRLLQCVLTWCSAFSAPLCCAAAAVCVERIRLSTLHGQVDGLSSVPIPRLNRWASAIETGTEKDVRKDMWQGETLWRQLGSMGCCWTWSIDGNLFFSLSLSYRNGGGESFFPDYTFSLPFLAAFFCIPLLALLPYRNITHTVNEKKEKNIYQ